METFDLDEELCKLRLEMSETPQTTSTSPTKTIREKLADKGEPEMDKKYKRKATRADSLLSDTSLVSGSQEGFTNNWKENEYKNFNGYLTVA